MHQATVATIDDLLAIPEDERRHELIEGVIYPWGAGTFEHGHAKMKMAGVTQPFSRRSPSGWRFAMSADIYFDEKNILCPDLSGWRRDRVPSLPNGWPVRIRPDWVCEILSTNQANDLIKKKRVYHRHQVQHYWVVDPTSNWLQVNRWTPDGYLEVLIAEEGETVLAEPFDAFPLRVVGLFGDDPDDEDLEESPQDESTGEQ